ncbi:MAG: IPT/TIG domain-containing protein, partial [Acidimicrobiales bacterium]
MTPPVGDVYQPGTTNACSAVRWATGAATIPSTADVLITYTNVCAGLGEDWGWAVYDSTLNTFVDGPVDEIVSSPGSILPSSSNFTTPIITGSAGQMTLTLYRFSGTSAYSLQISATSPMQLIRDLYFQNWYISNNSLSTATIPSAPYGGSASVGYYPGSSSYYMIELLTNAQGFSIPGVYDVLEASSSNGPWRLLGSATLPGDCNSPPAGTYGCRALIGHPELSSSLELMMSYFDPGAGPKFPANDLNWQGHLVGIGVALAQFEGAVAVPTVTSISPTSGTTGGGTSVTVTGTNFTGASAVHFGSTAATGGTVKNATQITAVSPPESVGTVNVTVTTPSGTSATSSADQFTSTSTPTATVPGAPTGLTATPGNGEVALT